MTTYDIELGYGDIQALSNADAVAAFFERLGYNTSVRRIQTPANLGITAESILKPIRKIELVADQDGLLQVYLFEMRSVTVAYMRAIANAFRLLTVTYPLLVLTSDYERLDFVLLEREQPAGPGSGIGAPQVKIRPRTLTIERRKPERLHLRILRRLTFTEPDPFAQYDKLAAAYTVAAWSEEYFNNRALFSDHYLSERLREFLEWNEDAKPAWARLRGLYADAAARLGGKDRTVIGRELFQPVFEALGFSLLPGEGSDGASYVLYAQDQSEGSPLALCLAYPWDRMLDAKDYGRDAAAPEVNPGAQVVSLLEGGDAPWVIVTNGRLWRLYSRRAHSRATNYYEIDLSDLLADQGPGPAEPGDAFRYFWLLFRRESFVPATIVREGRETALSLVDRVLDESEEYARKLGEDLKRRVFDDIFPLLAEGFVDFMHREGATSFQPVKSTGWKPVPQGLSQDALDAIFRGTLTLLYRLLFILYAEARDLLPVKETRGYFEVSLSCLRQEIAEAAGPVRDEAAERLGRRYCGDSFELYDRLAELFAIIDRGRAAINVPVYNGGLFLSDPKGDDTSEEAQVSRFLLGNKIADRFLAPALDLLARDEDPKSFKLVPIDFKSLGVRQLGSIYEGLLEFRLRVANEKLAIVKEKNRELYRPVKELSEAERERAERQQRIIAKGRAYLENDRRERKATGSYYTPDHIVAYIVEQAIGPVVKEKFETLRPMLREAQAWHRDHLKNARTTGEDSRKYESGPAVENRWRALIDRFFDIKVLDPAMGSGHFLVEAVDYITDKALDFLNAFPWNPITAHLADVRESIVHEMDEQGITIDIRRLTDVNLLKRHVLKRCIYGVDLNPMAVELAKVSLWLDCFTLGAPLSFLDHHLRCGNSLIGVSVREVQSAIEWKEGQTRDLFGSQFTGLMLATDLMRHVGELSDVTSAQVRESRAEYRKASEALEPFKRILDVYTSQWFGNEAPKKSRGRNLATESPAIAFLKSRAADAFLKARSAEARQKALAAMPPANRQVADTALIAAEERRFFHWELEFPEVFYGPRPGTERTIERLDSAGFDAVIGNPPFDELSESAIGHEVGETSFLRGHSAYSSSGSGRMNWYHFFIIRAVAVLHRGGRQAYIVPMSLLADKFTQSLRRWLLQSNCLLKVEVFPQKDDPERRVFREAKLPTCLYVLESGLPPGQFSVRVHPDRYIEPNSRSYKADIATIQTLDSENWAIPLTSDVGLNLAQRIARSGQIGKLSEFGATPSSGEIVFNEAFRKYLTSEPTGTLILRGSHVQRYQIVGEAKQGAPVFLKKEQYLRDSRPGSKAFDFRSPRVVYQECAAIDNWRRVIAAYLPAGNVCGHKICYFKNYKCPPFVLLAIFNSALIDWLVGGLSTNNSLPAYLVAGLPFPRLASSDRVLEDRDLVRNYEEWMGRIEGLPFQRARDSSNDTAANILSAFAHENSEGTMNRLANFAGSLAKRMMEMHIVCADFAKRFLEAICASLKVAFSDLQSIPGKTVLKNIIGDYQKEESHQPFDRVWSVLGRRRELHLSDQVRGEVKEAYDHTLEKMLPLKSRLAGTDQLIDLIVYNLYDLSEAEIRAVADRRRLAL